MPRRIHGRPLAVDVRQGRAGALYNAHGYHTKVPPSAIVRYLLHYTRPGELVYDGFCGSGMTGVAAQLCGAPDAELRRAVEDERRDGPPPVWGPRRALLSDLSPAATFIADGMSRLMCDWQPAELLEAAMTLADEVEREVGWMFETAGEGGRTGRVIHTLFSDLFACPRCAAEIVYWQVAVDARAGVLKDRFRCPACRAPLSKRELERMWDERIDPALGVPARVARSVPIEITYELDGRRQVKAPDPGDLLLREPIARALAGLPRDAYPSDAIRPGDKTGDLFSVGIRHVHQLYSDRNLVALAALWRRARARGIAWLVTGILPRASKQHQVAISRVGGPRRHEGGKTAGHRRGTLYVPSNQIECNPIELFRERARLAARACGQRCARGQVTIETRPAARSQLADDSVDYLFVDPPFGGNIQYSELNQIWEAWLGERTDVAEEAVVNRSRGKDLADYRRQMEASFRDFYRVLKPDRFMTLVFHNSRHEVWNALAEALVASGFVVEAVHTLDKVIRTHTQRTARGTVEKDLVISARKPPATRSRKRGPLTPGRAAATWRFVERRLKALPRASEERRGFFLYSRAVAYHLQRSQTVPVDAAPFYGGLGERFVSRDGLWYVRPARRRKIRLTARAG